MDNAWIKYGIVIVILCAVGWFLWHREPATVMPQEQTTDVNAVQNRLEVNKQNAKEIVTQIKEIHTYTKEPVATYIETSPEPVKAVEEKLEKKDVTLPPEALKDTDKTVVTTDGTKVDVYKINTYRNWEFGVGIGRHGNESYVPVSLQRNYDRVHSITVEAHVNEQGIRGGEVQWKVHF